MWWILLSVSAFCHIGMFVFVNMRHSRRSSLIYSEAVIAKVQLGSWRFNLHLPSARYPIGSQTPDDVSRTRSAIRSWLGRSESSSITTTSRAIRNCSASAHHRHRPMTICAMIGQSRTSSGKRKVSSSLHPHHRLSAFRNKLVENTTEQGSQTTVPWLTRDWIKMIICWTDYQVSGVEYMYIHTYIHTYWLTMTDRY